MQFTPRYGVAQSLPESQATADFISTLKFGAANRERLAVIADRVRGLSDALCGSIPRDAGAAQEGIKGANGLLDAFVMQFDAESRLLDSIEADMNRISRRLPPAPTTTEAVPDANRY